MVFKLIKFILIVFLLSFSTASCFEKARYDNYRVYKIAVENEEQLELMKHIESYPDGYRFMDFPGGIGKNAQLVVPPHKYGEFHELVGKFQLKSRLQIKNLQEVFDNEQPKQRKADVLDWTRYWNLEEVNSWMKNIADEHPNDAEIINIGKSYEGRDILGIKFNIGKKPGKKQVFVEGTIHAREWISTATTTWILNELMTSSNLDVKQLAEEYEWIIFPVVNVDGYVYTWTTDRFWRKTRQPSSLLCFGADPNRNWDVYFGKEGASNIPCSDLYTGPHPFSEPETKQLSEFISALPNLAVYLDFHSFSQLLMIPYGHTTELLDNYEELYEIGVLALKSLKSRFGTEYEVGSIANIIYLASGGSIDWVKYHLHTNVTYVYELRDNGQYGFALPAIQIIDNCLEVFDSFITIMKESQKRGIA